MDDYLKAPPTTSDLKHIHERLGAMEGRLASGDGRFASIETKLDSHAAAIAENTEVTKDVRDILATARTGFKVLGGLGKLGQWAAWIAGGIGAVWGLIQAITHNSNPPGH